MSICQERPHLHERSEGGTPRLTRERSESGWSGGWARAFVTS